MAGGVTDREEHGDIPAPSLVERFGVPGVPIHRVFGVLEKVGTGLSG
jgi:hypothetical protein